MFSREVKFGYNLFTWFYFVLFWLASQNLKFMSWKNN